MTNNKMPKILNTNYRHETHDQFQQSKTFCLRLRVSFFFNYLLLQNKVLKLSWHLYSSVWSSLWLSGF